MEVVVWWKWRSRIDFLLEVTDDIFQPEANLGELKTERVVVRASV
jgi:hypothetical protein